VAALGSETLALRLSPGLLCADRDDHALGRPLVYRSCASGVRPTAPEQFTTGDLRRHLRSPFPPGRLLLRLLRTVLVDNSASPRIHADHDQDSDRESHAD
jgi:hypothetical protein